MSRKKKWEEEYDRRVASGKYKTDTMKSWRVGGNETRVVDDEGVMRRRNGDVCCGCGKGDYGPHAHDVEHGHLGFRLNEPAHDHHHDDKDDGPKLFLGIF